MKKLIAILILSLVCVFCAVGFSGCGVEFKINFVVDGEVYATVNTNGGETIKLPDNPEKEDDIFDGWYWDKDTWEKPFTANSLLDAPLSSDMSVYAKWKGYNRPNANAVLISAEGFTMDGMKGEISVSNDTEVYSFINQIKVSDRATWVISRDIYGMQTVATKTIPLEVGDNTVYLLVTSGDGESISLYIMTVHRRTFYTVSFNTNGGTAANSQQIEEDSFAIEPVTTRAGYTLDGWTYDFNEPITNNTMITAKWKANTDTPYQVKHYIQNEDDDNYTLEYVEILTGTTDTQVSAVIKKDIPHYSYVKANSIISGNLNGDGSTVLKVYYNIDKFTIRITASGNVSLNKTYNGTYKYGEIIPDIVATYNENMCFEWKGWYSDGEFLTNDTVIPSFTVDRNVNYVAVCEIKADMSNFTFTTTETACTITGIKDKTVTEIIVPDCVTNIAERAFYGCSRVKKVFISDSVRTIDDYAFANCSGLTELEILYGVTSIGYHAFENCSNLTNAVIPNSVEFLGSAVFAGCSKMESITVPFLHKIAGLTSNDKEQYPFGDIFWTKQFSGSISIKQYYYGNSTSSTTSLTFYIPATLKQVTVTGGNILYGAFYNCSMLESITLGDSVTSIGDRAFYGCSGLKNVVIGSGIETCGANAFDGCGNLNAVYYTGNIAGWCSINWGDYSNPVWTAHNLYINNQLVTNLVIPDCVTYIGGLAFDRCLCLNGITIPKSVKTINRGAFWFCTNLTNIYFEGTKSEWQAISKGENWKNQVPSSCKVHCSDGDLNI